MSVATFDNDNDYLTITVHIVFTKASTVMAVRDRGLSDVISSHGVITCRTREWNI